MTEPSGSPDTAAVTGPSPTSDTSGPRYPGTPRWVKLSGIVVLILVLVLVTAHLAGGGMGPGMHVAPAGGH
jgi:hypothetical protein